MIGPQCVSERIFSSIFKQRSIRFAQTKSLLTSRHLSLRRVATHILIFTIDQQTMSGASTKRPLKKTSIHVVQFCPSTCLELDQQSGKGAHPKAFLSSVSVNCQGCNPLSVQLLLHSRTKCDQIAVQPRRIRLEMQTCGFGYQTQIWPQTQRLMHFKVSLELEIYGDAVLESERGVTTRPQNKIYKFG